MECGRPGDKHTGPGSESLVGDKGINMGSGHAVIPGGTATGTAASLQGCGSGGSFELSV